MRISDWSSDVCSSDLRQFTDFVQKNCAPIGVNEPADLTLECASECPAFMAEQFGFDEIGRDRAAIHGNHALLETGRGRMNGLRNDFLADAAFAFDQYRNARAGGNRKSVVWGKGVSVRVAIGGGRIIK